VEPAARSASVTIARIVRTRGNRGEVLAELHTDFPNRFDSLKEVWLEFADGRKERIALTASWEHQGRRVLKFAAVDTIADAEKLVGAWVQVDSSDRVPLPDGTFYDHDLIGCCVRDSNAEFLGTVTDVLHVAGYSLLEVKGLRGEFMVPAVTSIIKDISVSRKEIRVDLPDGLIDLNK
jgi:16S rRNA processing protein RimM